MKYSSTRVLRTLEMAGRDNVVTLLGATGDSAPTRNEPTTHGKHVYYTLSTAVAATLVVVVLAALSLSQGMVSRILSPQVILGRPTEENRIRKFWVQKPF